MSIKENLVEIKKKCAEVNLVAVSKYSGKEEIEQAYECGQRIFGENRVPDLLEKSQKLAHLSDIEWHFMGELQTNKIGKLLEVKNLCAIHSIYKKKQVQELNKKSDKVTSEIKLFIQVNTSDEAEKSGVFSKEEVIAIASEIQSPFKFQGLMTMGKLRTEDPKKSAKECFMKLGNLRDELDPSLKLSMGMSSDFEIAIESGADYVRIGSLIFK